MRHLAALLLVIGCGVIGCGPPDPVEVEATHAFVRRSAATVDTVQVATGADTLAVDLDIRLIDGEGSWSLLRPDGREAWRGTVSASDTVARWQTPRPASGAWRFVVTPDSAIGVARIGATVR